MSSDVVVTRRGALGHLLLDRPWALNALTAPMVAALDDALSAWERDDAVRAVVVSGAGERGLCAGGDVVAIYRDALAGGTAGRDFWAAEYRLNARIAAYPKPYVALMDGIVLGGGVGVSAHGSARVVTERSRVGMPEVGIGFVPDVGSTYLLSRAPGELGTHLALTGEPVEGADAIAVGLSDTFVAADRLPTLIGALADALDAAPDDPAPAVIERVLADVAVAPPPSALLAAREWIDACYAGDDVAAIVARLRACGAPAATDAAEVIARRSPSALAVTLAALRRAAAATSVADVLRQDYRVGVRFLGVADMREGIRAQLVDKDRRPQWSPPALADVDPAWVHGCFDPLPEGDLTLPGSPAA